MARASALQAEDRGFNPRILQFYKLTFSIQRRYLLLLERQPLLSIDWTTSLFIIDSLLSPCLTQPKGNNSANERTKQDRLMNDQHTSVVGKALRNAYHSTQPATTYI